MSILCLIFQKLLIYTYSEQLNSGEIKLAIIIY